MPCSRFIKLASITAVTALALLATHSQAAIVVPEAGANDTRIFTAPGVSSFISGANQNNPTGTGVDAANNVYVVNNADFPGSIAKFSPTMAPLGFFVPNAPGNGLNVPYDITFDSSGNAFVTNTGIFTGQTGVQQGGITEYSPAGVLLAQFGLGSSRVPAGLDVSTVFNPAAGAGYNLYVAESASNTLNLYSTTSPGSLAGVINPFGALAFNNPNGVAVDNSRGLVYVVNSGTTGVNAGTVEIYNINTNTESIFVTGLNAPAGITVDPSGNVYVTNNSTSTTNGQILEYNPAGALIATFATGLNKPGLLSYTPVAAAVPEPSNLITLGLCQLGAAGFWYVRRKRNTAVAA